MKVLVAVASKHGATREIADEIGNTLRAKLGERAEVEVLFAANVATIAGYDAVVLGSAVYMGHWMTEATDFVHRYQEALRTMPVWMFSSGPVGTPPKPLEEPLEIGKLRWLAYARGHRVFAGRIDRHRLGLGDRAVVAALRVHDGDYRNWEEIRSWAATIATALRRVRERAHTP
ncbi:flavodoxin domain-containing protein [Amycolatopsis sp. GM8]|uniref:flavodoxin domain-containing protein n=1 Tax=Amycolatopsis sp. GM8 TaxID=2896530 RepID=UPI001F43AAD9|nr:flavodoxin domain-containing protein [Amycolatopsis sp. GM8]